MFPLLLFGILLCWLAFERNALAVDLAGSIGRVRLVEDCDRRGTFWTDEGSFLDVFVMMTIIRSGWGLIELWDRRCARQGSGIPVGVRTCKGHRKSSIFELEHADLLGACWLRNGRGCAMDCACRWLRDGTWSIDSATLAWRSCAMNRRDDLRLYWSSSSDKWRLSSWKFIILVLGDGSREGGGECGGLAVQPHSTTERIGIPCGGTAGRLLC